jgi:phenylpropionate dioxygenase-like ring-hydroxylating dioxygenase large terminal subunit
VIQNFSGILKAFQNVCAHRFKIIQTEEFGNRPLLCGYHGWSYDKDGIPKVPHSDTFDKFELCRKKLTQYHLDFCGDFVFICFNQPQKTLKDQLGLFYEELQLISHDIGPLIRETKINYKANWKILVENVLEGYHCPMVHRQTLVKSGYCINYPEEIKNSKNNSSHHSPRIMGLNEESHKNLSFLNSRTFKHDSFYHIFVFPNLFIASTSGYLFYIGRLTTSSVAKSEISAKYYYPKYSRSLSKKETAMNVAFGIINADSGINILMEDVSMIESCQEGINQPTQQTGILSQTKENRITHFHNIVKRLTK